MRCVALIERLLAIDRCESVYREAQRFAHSSLDVRLVHALGLTIDVEEAEVRSASPRPVRCWSSPITRAVQSMVSRCRRWCAGFVRTCACWPTRLLPAFPELKDLCFFVDPFGGRDGDCEESEAGCATAHRWLRHGGVLIVFPSGEVAHRALPDGLVRASRRGRRRRPAGPRDPCDPS